MLDMKKALTKLMQTPMVVESGTNGIWAYRKWSDGTYDAWCDTTVNMGAGSAWLGGYFHTTYSALNPPSFSTGVSSMYGTTNAAQLTIYCGHATDYKTYWLDGVSTTRDNIPVHLEMHGTWS